MPDEGPLKDQFRFGTVVAEDDLAFFEHAMNPVWVFDVERFCVPWANDAACRLWEAADKEELYQRDFGVDMSPSANARLQQYIKEFQTGAVFDESWSIYPNGVAKTMVCRFRGCRLSSGRMAMLCEAQEVGNAKPELLRSAQALLYTGAMVSAYAADGEVVFSNPAALTAFGSDFMRLRYRILDDAVMDALDRVISDGQEGRHVSEVRTTSGIRIHEIDARQAGMSQPARKVCS